MYKVIVAGGGPAGLAAAEALAEQGKGRVQVDLVVMGHHLGGKACSWRLPDGRVVEHGQHVMLGFYRELRALLGRAGVDARETSVSNNGRFVIWEDRDHQAHDLHLGPSAPGTLVDGLRYSGWSLGEKAGFAQLFARALPRVAPGVPEAWDDLCLTAWCLQRGLPASAARTNAFRATREAQLNWPGETSAYAMLSAIRAAGRDYQSAEARVPAGGMSEIWWEPVAQRVRDLGGRVRLFQQAIAVGHQDGRATGLHIGAPQPHPPGGTGWDGAVPIAPGSELFEEADAVILAVPPPCAARVLGPELLALPGLQGIPLLSTVAPLGLHLWHRQTPHPRRPTIVCGMKPPLPFVVDNKPNYAVYRDDPAIGAALHFVGQEAGFEDWSDLDLALRALACLRRIEGYEHLDDDGIIDIQAVRSRGPHNRYWNTEPGSLRFKPQARTPVQGLFLAGDWVRSKLDFPCMENAVRTGRTAARLALEHIEGRAGRSAA